MNALAKTSDFFSDVDASEYVDPAIFRTNRLLMSSDLYDQINPGTTAIATPLPAKTSQLRIFPQKITGFQKNFKLLQQWEGTVEKISGDTIVAIIVDKKMQIIRMKRLKYFYLK